MNTVNRNEQQYLDALRRTLSSGDVRSTRNGVTKAIFAHQMRFNLQEGFPAITTKFLAFRVVAAELLWFLDAGKETGNRLNIVTLNRFIGKPDNEKNIWTNDQARFAREGKALSLGDCGRIYGAQWRDWKKNDGTSVDQIAKVINQLREDPYSRYHIVIAWNPGELNDMCLPPCHMKMQFFVRSGNGKKYLDLSMDQRSCDMFLGVPFNIASYALLLHMVAQCVDMIPGELIITLEDCHIYVASITPSGEIDATKGHLQQVEEQLQRKPSEPPSLWIDPAVTDIDGFTMESFRLDNYRHLGKIEACLL